MATTPKAAAAGGSPPPPSAAAADEKTVEFLVNQAFRTSDYFQFAKWVLLVSLGLVGAGSLTVFGLNMDIAGQMMKMRERVQQVDEEIKKTIADRTKTLDTTIDAAQSTISKRAEEAGKTLKLGAEAKLVDLSTRADSEIGGAIGEAKKKIADLEKKLSGELTQQQSGLSQNIAAEQMRLEKLSMAIVDQEKKLAGLKSRVNGFEQNLGSILATESKLASGTVTGNLQLIGAVLESAAACVVAVAIVAIASLLISLLSLWMARKAA
jgi:Sec-independent protein translocase protein TatA